MDKNRIRGAWKMVQGKLKEYWGKFRHNKTTVVKAKGKQAEGLIQERYGRSKDRMRNEIDALNKGPKADKQSHA